MAISETQAAQILHTAHDKTFETAAKLEQAGMQAELGAKQGGVKAAIKQQHGEVIDSMTKFSAAGLGCFTNAKLAMKANSPTSDIRKMKDEADAKYQERIATRKATLQSVSQSGTVPQVFSNGADVLSQTFGGAAMANQAKVETKVAELNETMAKTQREAYGKLREAASKDQDSVNDFEKGIYDRQKQVADNASR